MKLIAITASLAWSATLAAAQTAPTTTPASQIGSAINNVNLPRFPSVSPDGSQVVFTWRGDLWRVDSKGGSAKRLTVNPQDDNFSVWSPDGRQIAFTSERVGGGNVFTMNADGTGVRQVSNTDRYLTVLGWTPNDGLIVHGRIEHDWFPSLRSYAVPLTGGDPTRLFDAYGSLPSVSPDNTKVLFTRGTTAWSRRNYRGADARELWLYDRTNKTYTRLTNWNGNDGRGKWLDDRTVVFASDQQDETVNLYALTLGEDASKARRLTNLKGVDVEEFDVSRDGKTLVYASWDRLYRLDPTQQGAQATPIDIAAEEDAGSAVQFRSVDRSVSEAALSPDGKAMAVVSFGQVYVRGTEAKSATRRVNTSLSRCRDLAWSPDGTTLYFASDESGVESIYATTVKLSRGDVKRAADEAERPAGRSNGARRQRAVNTAAPQGPQPTNTDSQDPIDPMNPNDPTDPGATTAPATMPATTQATTMATTTSPAAGDAKANEERSRWADALQFEVKTLISTGKPNTGVDPSPDGKSLAFERGQGQLWIFDIASGKERQLVDGWSGSLSWRWSPDSRHIAYVTEDVNNNQDIFIVPADGSKKAVNITRHPDNDHSPRWSADGKRLAFLSERNENEADVYAVFLDEDIESLQGADLDQYYKDAADRAKKRERPKRRAATQPATTQSADATTTRTAKDELDLEDAYLRVSRLTSLPGSESDLEIVPAGDKVLFTARSMGSRATFILERGEGGEPKRIGNAVSIGALNFEGDKAIITDANRAGTMNLSTGQIEYADISDRLAVEMVKFNEQKFAEAARVLGAIYYDEKMNGLDWPAVTKRYLELARLARTPAEFDHVGNKLVGELNGSHLGIRSPDLANPDAITNGRLGIRWKREDNGYRVTQVLEEGPASEGPMRLRVDDVITAVEGEAIKPSDTLESKLANRTGRETLVTVSRGGRDVHLLITPISYEAEAGLAYEQWRSDVAKKVDELSGGKLGYIHIRGMNLESLATFERDLFAAADGKQGLLIDVRNNGGGSTTDLLLGSIMYPRHAYTIPRGFKGAWNEGGYPQDRLYIQRYNLPINLLCNEKSFSNAEIFSHAFKNLKRGTLVGQQTAGGVISTGATSLLDGTSVRLPNRGWYTPDGKNMELNGAMPDLVVPQTPEAESAEDDQQLKTAVDDLMKRVGR